MLQFDFDALGALLADEPELETGFLELILGRCLDVLAERRTRIVEHSRTPVNFADALDAKGEEETYNRAPPPVMELLRRSPFFEVFEEGNLRQLAQASRAVISAAASRWWSRAAAARGCGCWPRGGWR